MFLLIAFPAIYAEAFGGALNLFILTALPVTLPFFIFSSILMNSGFAAPITKLTKKTTLFIFNSHEISGYIFLMSLLCGYPIGAKLISDFYETGTVTAADARSMLPFTSTASPLFILITVAAGMLQNPLAGLIILVAHYLGAIVNGLLFKDVRCKMEDGRCEDVDLDKREEIKDKRQKIKDKRDSINTIRQMRNEENEANCGINLNNTEHLPSSILHLPSNSHLPSSILHLPSNSYLPSPSTVNRPLSTVNLLDIVTQSTSATLGIGAFLALFTMIITMLNHLGFMPANEVAKGIISSLIEITQGLQILSASNLTIKLSIPIFSALISFGGLSVAFQSMAFLSKCKIKFRFYLFAKLTQTIITFFICLIICLVVW